MLLSTLFSTDEMFEFLAKRGYEKITVQTWENAERGNDIEYDSFTGVIKSDEKEALVNDNIESFHRYEAERRFSIGQAFTKEMKKVLLAL